MMRARIASRGIAPTVVLLLVYAEGFLPFGLAGDNTQSYSDYSSTNYAVFSGVNSAMQTYNQLNALKNSYQNSFPQMPKYSQPAIGLPTQAAPFSYSQQALSSFNQLEAYQRFSDRLNKMSSFLPSTSLSEIPPIMKSSFSTSALPVEPSDISDSKKK